MELEHHSEKEQLSREV